MKDLSRYLGPPTWILTVLALGWLAREAAPIFTWITSAFLLFTLLDGPAEALKARGWPVVVSALVLVALATVVLGGGLYLCGHLAGALLTDLEASRRIFLGAFATLNGYWTTLNASFNGSVPTGDFGGTILHGVSSVVSALTYAVLVPVLTFFLLVERDALAAVAGAAFADRAGARRTWAQMTSATWAFCAGNVVLAIVTFPMFAAVAFGFGVPSLFVTAALATVLNLVPFAGAVLAGALPTLALFAHTGAWAPALALYGCCVVIHLLVADVLTPRLLGARVNINATTSTIAMVAWGELWGGVGLLLAIPLTSLLKIGFEHAPSRGLNWLARAMSHQVDRALEPEAAVVTATPG